MGFMEIGVDKIYTLRLSEEKRNTLLLQLENLDLTDNNYCGYILEFIDLLNSEK